MTSRFLRNFLVIIITKSSYSVNPRRHTKLTLGRREKRGFPRLTSAMRSRSASRRRGNCHIVRHSAHYLNSYTKSHNFFIILITLLTISVMRDRILVELLYKSQTYIRGYTSHRQMIVGKQGAGIRSPPVL